MLWSNHGDPYYIGLNGIQIFDHLGRDVFHSPDSNKFRIEAFPEGVFEEKLMAWDERKVSNLINQLNDNCNYENIWLAPLLKPEIDHQVNSISFVFEQPVVFSLVNVWNYIKDPERGVKNLLIFVDDQLVWNGSLSSPSNFILNSIPLSPLSPSHSKNI